jgi:adenylate cyclase
MNQFLTILSRAILDQKGTIDKFMGDAVMAFWNAPLDNDDHVRSACRASLRMIADIETFNINRMSGVLDPPIQNRKDRQPPPATPPRKVHRLNVGIGINTGQCVVGNMGSDTRFDYTALGDPVNVASRLEGQSRYYSAPIILGQTTAREVISEFALMQLDLIRVVGKDVPENIFALLGDETMRARPEHGIAFEHNEQMLQAYRTRNWDLVEELLPVLRQDFDALGVDLDLYLKMYRDRVADLRAHPPEEGWDGVFASTKK